MVMACHTLIHLKEVCQLFVYVQRIRVPPPIAHVLMAVLARHFSVDGYMKSFATDQPPGFGRDKASQHQKKHHALEKEGMPFHITFSIS
jgi:hypothetical protein